MTASTETHLHTLQRAAGLARVELRKAKGREVQTTIDFIDEARRAYWSWDDIGRGLGITPTGARRFYERNKRKVHGGDV
jgi:hypothetical protein